MRILVKAFIVRGQSQMLSPQVELRSIPEGIREITLETQAGQPAWINLGEPENGHTRMETIPNARLRLPHNNVVIHVPRNDQSVAKLMDEGFRMPDMPVVNGKMDVNFIYEHQGPCENLHDLMLLISDDTIDMYRRTVHRHPEQFSGLVDPRAAAFEFNMRSILLDTRDEDLHVWYEFDH